MKGAWPRSFIKGVFNSGSWKIFYLFSNNSVLRNLIIGATWSLLHHTTYAGRNSMIGLAIASIILSLAICWRISILLCIICLHWGFLGSMVVPLLLVHLPRFLIWILFAPSYLPLLIVAWLRNVLVHFTTSCLAFVRASSSILSVGIATEFLHWWLLYQVASLDGAYLASMLEAIIL